MFRGSLEFFVICTSQVEWDTEFAFELIVYNFTLKYCLNL